MVNQGETILSKTKKQKKKRSSTLTSLLSMQKMDKRKILANKNGTHMISFPKYWYQKWDTPFISIELKDGVIFVHNTNSKTDKKLLCVGGTRYIRLSDDVMEKLDYQRLSYNLHINNLAH